MHVRLKFLALLVVMLYPHNVLSWSCLARWFVGETFAFITWQLGLRLWEQLCIILGFAGLTREAEWPFGVSLEQFGTTMAKSAYLTNSALVSLFVFRFSSFYKILYKALSISGLGYASGLFIQLLLFWVMEPVWHTALKKSTLMLQLGSFLRLQVHLAATSMKWHFISSGNWWLH